jgi:hypothetical protein
MLCLVWVSPIQASEEDLEQKLEALRLEFEQFKEESKGTIKMPGVESLTISGEVRLREEIRDNIYAPPGTPPNLDLPNGQESLDFMRLRTRLRFDMAVHENLDAVIQLQDVRILGESTTNDAEGVDIKRGEILWHNVLFEDLTVEAGRFVMYYGDQRIIGHLEWVDQGRTYDGLRLSYNPEETFIDLFGFRINEEAITDANDADVFGIYAGAEEFVPGLGLEGYSILVRDQRRPVIGGVPQPLNMWEDRFWTYGVRLFGESNGLDYAAEAAYQNGDLGSATGDQSLRAKAFAVKGGYTFKDSDVKPRFGVELDYASGDDTPTDSKSQQFQTLFPTNHMHYGYADYVAWSNMWDYSGSFSFMPGEKVTIKLDYHHFRLADTSGGWINAGGALIRPGASGVSDHLGDEVDVTLKWVPTGALSFLTGWSWFIPGGFVEDTGRDPNSHFFYIQTRVVF